jgi:Gpi18-like mannosyltransferase
VNSGPYNRVLVGSVRDSRAPVWFWAALALGIALRIYLVIFTEGTYDVANWEKHARGVNELGLFDYYRSTPKANHPPVILEVESFLWRAAQVSGIPFRVLLRAPFAFLDVATALLLLVLLSFHRRRFVLVAIYWLNPLSLIFSAYHGNTDSSVAFFLLLAVWLLSREKIAASAIAVGVGVWIKLPGLVAVLAFLFYLQKWRQRLLFVCVLAIVALVGYSPALLHPDVIARNVFGYHGGLLQTTAGVPAWGSRVLFFSIIAPPDKWPEYLHPPVVFFLLHNWQIAVVCSVILSFLRRSRRSIPELGATIAMIYVVIYGLSDYWAFQYFAWSLPFWFFLPTWFFLGATLVASAYIYSLYWTLCGNGWLLGKWDFIGNPSWPGFVLIFRNLAVLFFFVCACVFLIVAIWNQCAALWKKSRETTGPSRR